VTVFYSVLLAIGAFLLGSVPFSVIIGRRMLKKDITNYGDGNPGSANVFKAGGRKTGFLAVVLDVLKGFPFVYLAHHVLDFPVLVPVAVAIFAVLGHAYSPFLHWHGGKAVAITFGVLLGFVPQYDMLVVFMISMVVAALMIENDAWCVIFGAVATLVYFIVAKGYSWEPLLMFCLLAILVIRHFEQLRSMPSLRGRLVRMLQAK
jgi:acyl phosphate:glycerol-3-phosphate acyltransferase